MFLISPRNSPKLGLVVTLCEIDLRQSPSLPLWSTCSCISPDKWVATTAQSSKDTPHSSEKGHMTVPTIQSEHVDRHYPWIMNNELSQWVSNTWQLLSQLVKCPRRVPASGTWEWDAHHDENVHHSGTTTKWKEHTFCKIKVLCFFVFFIHCINKLHTN